MPIYEYECGECGHQMDKLQKISDAPLLTCPACDIDALKKMISAAGFRLTGGGWYETDFKGGNKRNLVDSGKSDSSSDSKTSDSKTNSKSDSKASSKGTTTKKPTGQ